MNIKYSPYNPPTSIEQWWIRKRKCHSINHRTQRKLKKEETLSKSSKQENKTLWEFTDLTSLPLQTKFTNVIIACLTVQHIHQRRFHSFSRQIGILIFFHTLFFSHTKFFSLSTKNKTPKNNISHLQSQQMIRLSVALGGTCQFYFISYRWNSASCSETVRNWSEGRSL